MISCFLTLNSQPIGSGPLFTVLGGDIVLTELGQFSKSSLTLAAADERAVLAMTPYTLVEIVQDGVGTIQYGYVLNPRQQITDRDEHTITLELEPLTVECIWRLTRRGWTAATWLSIVAARLAALVPGWSATYINPAGDTQVSVTLPNPTVLGGFLSVAKQFAQFARQGVDAQGAPTRLLEMGQFGAAPTVTLTSANGGDVEEMTKNGTIRLVATVDRTPNNVADLVNVVVPFGGGQNDGLVTLERLWRILNDTEYPNYGRYGTDAESLARTGKTSVYPEYDPNYPLSDPLIPFTGAKGDPTQGLIGTRGVTLDGHFDYVMYDRISYYGDAVAGTPAYGHKEGQFVDSSLTYADNSVGNQELTERALYVSTTANFKLKAHPHHTFACTAEGRGRPTRAGDLIAVDYQRTSVQETGTVVEMNVTENLRVVKVVRRFSGEMPPMDTYTLSNLGRFDEDGTGVVAQQARQLVALQINQGTSLSPVFIAGRGNVDALHPLKMYFAIPAQLFRWQKCSLRVDFLPYTGTATTAENTPGTPIIIDVPHGAHSLAGAFTPDGTGLEGTTDGFDLVQTGVDNNAVVQILVSNDGGTQPLGQRLNAELLANPTRWRISSGALPDNTPMGANMKIKFVKALTKSAFTAAINKAVSVVSTLTADLPLHTHPLDQRIPDGPLPVSIAVTINGVALSSGVKVNSGTRNPDGSFASAFEVDDIAAWLQTPGQTVEIDFGAGTDAGNPYGVGMIQISGTWYGEYGGLTSTVRAA